MSRLTDLIAQLCPDGVEYRALGEMGSLFGGLSGKTKSDFTEVDGACPFVTYKEVYSLLEINQIPQGRVLVSSREKQLVLQRGDVLFTGSSENADEVGLTAVVTVGFSEPVYLNSFSICLRWYEHAFEPGYTKYLFASPSVRAQIRRCANGVTRFNLSKKRLEGVRVPVPPLEVQREIVRILDQFTTLEAELEAELEARQAQYEYYRNQLLSYDALASRGPVKWVKLGDIGTVKMCKRIHKKETADKGDVPFYKISSFGGAPTAFISRNQFMEYKSKYPYPKVGDLLISASGTIGRVVRFNGEDAYFQDSNIVWLDHDESIVSNRFLFYLYKVISWETEGGTIKRLYNSRILKQEIPVPSFCEQQRIADILDRFDALVNDISSGLPAEILARRAQYEYYRDRLLSFSEKK